MNTANGINNLEPDFGFGDVIELNLGPYAIRIKRSKGEYAHHYNLSIDGQFADDMMIDSKTDIGKVRALLFESIYRELSADIEKRWKSLMACRNIIRHNTEA